MRFIDNLVELDTLNGEPARAATVRVADRVTADYRAWIEAAVFCARAAHADTDTTEGRSP